MLIHYIMQPEYDEARELIGFSNITIKDHNHCLAAEMEYGDISNFLNDITPFLIAEDNVPPLDARNPNLPVGMFVPRADFRVINDILDMNGYKAGAANQIRNIMAVTANIHTVNFPAFNICHITINVICDYIPN